MKQLLPLIVIMLWMPIELIGQQVSQSNMSIKVEVTDGICVMFDEIHISVETPSTENDTTYIDPASDWAGLISIQATPNKYLSLIFPDYILLSNENGDKVKIGEFELLIGEENDPLTMIPFSTESCTEPSVSESGKLFIRVGGKISEKMEPDTIYGGTVKLDSCCL
ncbi:hypothetical protein [Rhodohalobacter halophilus]|uniref:hypothetical protein n=1 Tax=Rhodohalobacter halophilus TaxID=1812810 RepID=UPI00083F96D4|nr:hypothetical protein [Rhodohalobacter halophilus]